MNLPVCAATGRLSSRDAASAAAKVRFIMASKRCLDGAETRLWASGSRPLRCLHIVIRMSSEAAILLSFASYFAELGNCCA
jgi:hypothetical protein